MKTIIAVLCFGMSSIVLSDAPKSTCDIRTYLKGVWVYQTSLTYDFRASVKVKTGTPLLAYRMEFADCNDSVELKGMPTIVQKIRSENELRNLCSVWYKEDANLIDTFYPVALKVTGVGICEAGVVNYGKSYKGDYYMESLNADTLVISNGKHYIVDSIDYWHLRHMYVRQH